MNGRSDLNENERTKLINEENSATEAANTRPSGYGARHTLAILGFFGFFNVYALRGNLSVALVAMVNNSDTNQNSNISTVCPDPYGNNGTNSTSMNGEFDWDEDTQGIILGSFFYGYIITQIPGGRMAEMFGGKKLMGFGILITSVLTLVTPMAARLGLGYLMATRVVMGLGEGVTIPAMHSMPGKWAPRSETSILANWIYGGATFGSVVAMPVSGILCQSDFLGGWPAAFYVFGAIGCLWFVFWMALIYETPAVHPRISPTERLYIENSVGVKKKLPVPIKSILTSNAVWAIAVSHFTQAWGGYTVMTCLPMYMSKIQRYDITQDGLIMAIMYITAWIVVMLAAFLADWIRKTQCMSTSATRKLLNTIGMVAGAVSLLFIKQVGCNHDIVVTLLVISQGISQFNQSGFFVNHIDIAPNFAGTIMGITNMLANTTGIFAPYTVGLLTNNNQTFDQWQKVFYISTGMYSFGAVYFLLFSKGEKQKWNDPQKPETEYSAETNNVIDGKRQHNDCVESEADYKKLNHSRTNVTGCKNIQT